MEITVKLHHRWKPDDNERELVMRIARVVCWDDSYVFQKDTGYKWCLDTSNDWWTSSIENNTIKIAYRYGHGGNQAMMDSLKVLLEWILGPS